MDCTFCLQFLQFCHQRKVTLFSWQYFWSCTSFQDFEIINICPEIVNIHHSTKLWNVLWFLLVLIFFAKIPQFWMRVVELSLRGFQHFEKRTYLHFLWSGWHFWWIVFLHCFLLLANIINVIFSLSKWIHW